MLRGRRTRALVRNCGPELRVPGRFVQFRVDFCQKWRMLHGFPTADFTGVAFSPPPTCGFEVCDIRLVGIWHSKTVQHAHFLADSDLGLYDCGGGRREAADVTGHPRGELGERRSPASCHGSRAATARRAPRVSSLPSYDSCLGSGGTPFVLMGVPLMVESYRGRWRAMR